jgi:hypothetical protein
MIRLFCSIPLVGAVLLLALPAQAQTPRNECFFVKQFENWKGGPDEKTMYIRVSGNRFYRLDLANRCSELSWPDPLMVNKFRGTTICSPLDWDMRISRRDGGAPTPCMVKTMTRLSPAEVAALPKKQKP